MPPANAHRHRWKARIRSVFLLVLAVAMLPLLSAVPAHAATPSGVTAALARQDISIAPTSAPGAPTTTPTTAPTTAPTTTTDPTTDGAPTSESSPTAETTPATSGAGSGTWTISDTVREFLTSLDITLSDGPLTGTVSGTTLTVAINDPTLPLSLPAGVDLTVTGASLSVDLQTGTLTLAGSVEAGNGIGGSLSVTIAHSADADLNASGSTDLSSTVTVTGVPVLGTTVDLTGTLAVTGGAVSASITGTLDGDLTVVPGVLTIAQGTTVTLSSADGLAVSGTAEIGAGDTALNLAISGTLKGTKDFSLSVDDTDNPPTFAPASGLTLKPALRGTITDTAGAVRFDLSADDAATWNPTGDVTLSVDHVEISNDTPGSAVHCPASFADGDLWVDVNGTVSDTSSGISTSGGACIDLTAHAFTVSATEDGTFGPSDLGFDLSGANLSVTGDLKAGTVSAEVGATLTLTAVSGSPSFPVTLDVDSAGNVTAAASVDLSTLHLGTGTGTLLLSSREDKHYTNPAVGITDPIDLAAGVTVLLSYQPDDQVKQVLNLLNVPVPAKIDTQATLSTSGFSLELDLDLGAGSLGVSLVPGAPGGFQVYLDTLRLKVALTEAGGSVSIGGTAQLHIPALYSGSTASDVDLTLNGSLTLTDEGAVKISVGFDLNAPNGTWTDAFGIPGLSIGELAASVGVEVSPEQLDIPLPTVSFTVNHVVLPDSWQNAIGELPGADVSLTLDLDVDNPILSFAIAPGVGQTVALEPLRIANDFTSATHAAPLPDSVVNAVQLNGASLLFAPTGGTDATGHTVTPGASLVFDATIAGKSVHVDGSVGVAPYPHLSANVSVTNFAIGPIAFSGATPGTNPSLGIDVEANPAAPKIDFDFSGQFTDSVTGIRFGANVDLGASISAVNASVSLTIAAGQPSYLAAGAQLSGSVYTVNGGLGFSASGSASAYVGGRYVGSVWFTYSSQTGSVFAALSQLGNQIASWFRYVYGASDATVASVLQQAGYGANQIATTLQQDFADTDAQVASALTQIGTSANQIAGTLRSVFSDGDTAVASALNHAGQTLSNTAIAVRNAFGDGDVRITSVLQQVGASTNQIASVLQGVYGDSQAAVYNAFQQIGQGGQTVLDAISGFFNSGSYWIYSNPWWSVPLFLDDSGGSYAAGNGIIQWTWNGGHNQDWYVLPTDSGYAQIVNRMTGQCLSEFGGAGGQVVQYPCYGWTQQQWYLGIYPGQNLNYTGHTVTNRWSGLALDVNGGSTNAGAAIDTWYGNGNWNQWFTFEPAVG
jgi:hypothetical protein